MCDPACIPRVCEGDQDVASVTALANITDVVNTTIVTNTSTVYNSTTMIQEERLPALYSFLPGILRTVFLTEPLSVAKLLVHSANIIPIPLANQ